ncbi:MAG TPA: RNA polymerase sigma factor [Candidatus Limnocylindrales bacterium]|nr:RNA polymerase sigma factor [Candidatus Limnocylindrales bacterium]
MTTPSKAAGIHELDEDARLALFVGEHYERLLGLARLICRDTSDAADAVQLGLEQAWRSRASLRDEERLRPWLDRIVAREAVRVSKRSRSWLSRLLAPTPEVGWIEPADGLAPEPATRAALRAAYQTLSAEQRAVVALHMHSGYSIRQTAAIVGAPEETVRSRLRLAKERLRRELEEEAR